MDGLTDKLQSKLENTYDGVWDTPHAFQYLPRFEKLSEVMPVGILAEKYLRMINTFSQEMDRITRFFKKQMSKPPIPRNYPDSSGKIAWARSLLQHLKYFMEHFQLQKTLRHRPEYQHLVKQYNETGVMLMKFELDIQENWKNLRIRQIEFMISKPIFRTDEFGNFVGNFDKTFYTFLKENERLAKMDINIPSVNQFLIRQKTYFIEYNDTVMMILEKYNSAVSIIIPDLKRLFTPHVNKMRTALEPGLCEITWTNFDWEEFTEKCLEDIDNFRYLMSRANDIYDNRIEKVLKSMDEIKLYALPKNEPWTLERFLEEIKCTCRESASDLHRRSVMIEDAVEDLIGLSLQALNLPDPDAADDGSQGSSMQSPADSGDEDFNRKGVVQRRKWRKLESNQSSINNDGSNLLQVIDRNSQNAVNNAAKELRRNYSKKVADKLAFLTKTSLKVLSKHFAAAQDAKVEDALEEGGTNQDVVFVLTAYLSLPDIEVRPSIDEVQSVLATAGKIIMSVSKGVATWRRNVKRRKAGKGLAAVNSESAREMRLYVAKKEEKPVILEKPLSFYKMVSESKEVSKMYSMLAGCMQGIKMEFNHFIKTWNPYRHVWEVDREDTIATFVKKKPRLKHFEDELCKYNMAMSQLTTEKNDYYYGSILIDCNHLKTTIDVEIRQWISVYGKAMQVKYKREMDFIVAQVKHSTAKVMCQ